MHSLNFSDFTYDTFELLSAPLLVQNKKMIRQARDTIEVSNTFCSNIIGNLIISE